MKKDQLHINDDEYTRELERGLSVLADKINFLREQHRRVIMSMILSNGGRIIVPEKILLNMNPKDSIGEYRDPITGDYVYTIVIRSRKDTDLR